MKLSGFTLEWISPALMTHVNCALALLKQGQVHLGKGIGIILLFLTGLAEHKHLCRSGYNKLSFDAEAYRLTLAL